MITIRSRREEDDPRIVAIGNAAYPNLHVTVERYRHDLAVAGRNPRIHTERHVAEDGGQVTGAMTLEQNSWLGRPGSYLGEITVDPAYRSRGIGSRLNDLLESRARALGAQRLYGFIVEGDDASARFVEKRGYIATGRVDRLSRLPIARANLSGYEGLEERLAAEGIRVRSLAELGVDRDFLRKVWAMEHETEFDIPSAEEPGEPPPFEVWLEDKLSAPVRSPEMFWVALDGDRPIGVARVGERSKITLFNGYTAVDRAYRGRGVARLLKLKTVQFAQSKGYDWLYTGNDVDNTRILAINTRLGYEPLPAMLLMVKELAEGRPE